MENSPIYAEIYNSQLVEDAPALAEDGGSRRSVDLSRGEIVMGERYGSNAGMLQQEASPSPNRRAQPSAGWHAISARIAWRLLLVVVLIIGNTYTQVITPELTGQSVDCFFTPATATRA